MQYYNRLIVHGCDTRMTDRDGHDDDAGYDYDYDDDDDDDEDDGAADYDDDDDDDDDDESIDLPLLFHLSPLKVCLTSTQVSSQLSC